MSQQPPSEQSLVATLPTDAEVAAMTRVQLLAEGRRLQARRLGGLSRAPKDELVALVVARCAELRTYCRQQPDAAPGPAAARIPQPKVNGCPNASGSDTAPKDKLHLAYLVWLGMDWTRVWMLLVLAVATAVLFAGLGFVAHMLVGAPTVWSALGGGATGLGAGIGAQAGLKRYRNHRRSQD